MKTSPKRLNLITRSDFTTCIDNLLDVNIWAMGYWEANKRWMNCLLYDCKGTKAYARTKHYHDNKKWLWKCLFYYYYYWYMQSVAGVGWLIFDMDWLYILWFKLLISVCIILILIKMALSTIDECELFTFLCVVWCVCASVHIYKPTKCI